MDHGASKQRNAVNEGEEIKPEVRRKNNRRVWQGKEIHFIRTTEILNRD